MSKMNDSMDAYMAFRYPGKSLDEAYDMIRAIPGERFLKYGLNAGNVDDKIEFQQNEIKLLEMAISRSQEIISRQSDTIKTLRKEMESLKEEFSDMRPYLSHEYHTDKLDKRIQVLEQSFESGGSIEQLENEMREYDALLIKRKSFKNKKYEEVQ